ncbi:hypothetical protein M422DRAFT_245924 [Sphaerobolus stellatus SS14]|nr:hypothetical protein M422DRAFT_245924 [Sphaerobolus stellatus SS14]
MDERATPYGTPEERKIYEEQQGIRRLGAIAATAADRKYGRDVRALRARSEGVQQPEAFHGDGTTAVYTTAPVYHAGGGGYILHKYPAPYQSEPLNHSEEVLQAEAMRQYLEHVRNAGR